MGWDYKEDAILDKENKPPEVCAQETKDPKNTCSSQPEDSNPRTEWLKQQGDKIQKAEEAHRAANEDSNPRTEWLKQQGDKIQQAEEAHRAANEDSNPRTEWLQQQGDKIRQAE